jgi:putative acetyltransferase
MVLTFRHELPEDCEAIARVVRDAFDGEDEVRLLDALREADHLLLSIVAEDGGEVVAHIAFSPMTVESNADTYPAICLAPVAVTPSRQKQGIGGALITAALDELRAMGEGAVFLLGHPTYYPRFGFRPAREFDVHYQDDRDAFMALELREGTLDNVSGTAHFAPEFAPYE